MARMAQEGDATRRRSGFTLMEMLIVVAIIAVLVVIAIPVLTGTLTSARKATCEANRRSLKAELAAAAMSAGETDLSLVFDDPSAYGIGDRDSFTCPDGGTWTCDAAGDISCSKHPDEAADDATTTSKTYLASWLSFVGSSSGKSNDAMRSAFLADGKNPSITYDGVTYDVQPFSKGSASNQSWLFAKVGTENGNWNAVLVFDPVDGSWYRALNWAGDATGAAVISNFSDTDDLHQKVTTATSGKGDHLSWEKVTDVTVTTE